MSIIHLSATVKTNGWFCIPSCMLLVAFLSHYCSCPNMLVAANEAEAGSSVLRQLLSMAERLANLTRLLIEM